ncbi:hypothetical protein D3C87_666560 [compost metagenome]
MIPTRTEVTAFATAKIEEIKTFANKHFDLKIDRMIIDINFKDTNRLGLGGRKGAYPFMRLNLGKLVKYEVKGYNEYATLQSYVGVSSFYTTNWKLWLETLIVHEFAHVVQFALPNSTSKLQSRYNYFDKLGRFENGHGDFFKAIYRVLRNEFVNDRISDVYHNVEVFDIPDEDKQERIAARKEKRAKQISTEHPLMGSKIPYKGKVYVISEYNKRAPKYALVGVAACGARLRMPEDYARAHRI